MIGKKPLVLFRSPVRLTGSCPDQPKAEAFDKQTEGGDTGLDMTECGGKRSIRDHNDGGQDDFDNAILRSDPEPFIYEHCLIRTGKFCRGFLSGANSRNDCEF